MAVWYSSQTLPAADARAVASGPKQLAAGACSGLSLERRCRRRLRSHRTFLPRHTEWIVRGDRKESLISEHVRELSSIYH